MRVLFWSETFWPRVGGVENLAARLLPALRARGHDFRVITWEHTRAPDEISYEGIPVYRFPFFAGGQQSGPGLMMEHLNLVAKLKREYAPDLVHINSYGRSVFFHLLTANTRPVPVLLTLHQALPDEPVGRATVLGKILHTVDWVTCCSAAVLEQTSRLVPEISARMSVIHNALEVPAANSKPISFEPPILLFLGRLVPEKGLDWALAALTAVFHRFPNARLIIAGDGPEREELVRQTSDLRLTDSVKFIGHVRTEMVSGLIENATLLLIPSRLEGFGLVALEAALVGRPVVATRVGGLLEVVHDRETGLLVDLYDGDAFAEAVEFLLNHTDAAVRMGRAARSHAIGNFSWDRHVDAYDSVYRKLVQ